MYAQGARLLFYDSRSDVLLLDVPGQLPNSFNSYRIGYDATAGLVPRRAVCIHHPSGNVKRISYANNTCGFLSRQLFLYRMSHIIITILPVRDGRAWLHACNLLRGEPKGKMLSSI